MYGFTDTWRLKICQTVVCGISSSRLARLVDWKGLRWKLSLILSTLSSDTRGRSVLFLCTNILFFQTAYTTYALSSWCADPVKTTKIALHSYYGITIWKSQHTKRFVLSGRYICGNWLIAVSDDFKIIN